ncbi:MAG: 2-C-methyl-D-erythritol 4-phosphate cytidylyltransferase [Mycoplasma sp.]
MNIAIILAGGFGTRIKSEIPKQFIEIKNKPIIVYTIETFLSSNQIDKVIITCNSSWITHLKNILDKFNLSERIEICEGGENRNKSILNAIEFCEGNNLNSKENILITHDAARMFITKEIIEKNIEICNQIDSVNTVIPMYDSVLCSDDKKYYSSTVDREKIFIVQTPQTFNYKILSESYKNASEELLNNCTDACSLVNHFNHPIKLILGDRKNIKITDNYDLDIAEFLLTKKY